jgi:hypothetical protein
MVTEVADGYATYVVIHLAAVLGITSCAADFLGPSGMRVNPISPFQLYQSIHCSK